MRRPLRSHVLVAAACLALLAAACAPLVLSSDQAARLETFDRYWEALEEHYPYFTRHRAEPSQLRARYRAAAAYTNEPIDFYHLLIGLLCELQDAHVGIDLPGGLRTSYPTGLVIRRVEHADYVLGWPDGQAPPAPEALVGPDRHLPRVVAIDGYPVPPRPLLRDLLATGLPGTRIELDLEWPDGTRSRHYVVRDPPEEPAPDSDVPDGEKETPDPGVKPPESYDPPMLLRYRAVGRDPRTYSSLESARENSDGVVVAVLHVHSFLAEGDEIPLFERRFDELLDEAQRVNDEMIIVDLQHNRGGIAGRVDHVVGRFLKESQTSVHDIGAVKERLSLWVRAVAWLVFPEGRYIQLESSPREPAWPGRVVVLVDQSTGSAAEKAALLLQRHAEAVVIGTPTAGAEAGVIEIEGSDGSKLTFGALREVDSTGRSLQDLGVLPNLPAVVSIEELRRAAFDSLDEGRTDFDAAAHHRSLLSQRIWRLVDGTISADDVE